MLTGILGGKLSVDSEMVAMTTEWAYFKNSVACALVVKCLYIPESFTSVKDWQSKLYAAIADVL